MIIDQGEFVAAQHAVRNVINGTGYGGWISDAQCAQAAHAVVEAIEAYRASKAPPPPVVEQPAAGSD